MPPKKKNQKNKEENNKVILRMEDIDKTKYDTMETLENKYKAAVDELYSERRSFLEEKRKLLKEKEQLESVINNYVEENNRFKKHS